MIQHVRFNIRNRQKNVSDVLKIGGKDRKILSKMSEVENINLLCCTIFLRPFQI